VDGLQLERLSAASMQGDMPRKISNAPGPVRPLPSSVASAAPESEPLRSSQLKHEQLAEETCALNAYYRFGRAAHVLKQAIKNADGPEIDEARRTAEACLRECSNEQLRAKISSRLDSLKKYRAALRPRKEAKKRGIISNRMVEDVRQGKIPLSQLRYMSGKDLKESYGSYTNHRGKVCDYDRGTISNAHEEALRILVEQQ
jgi:hypothetical protein